MGRVEYLLATVFFRCLRAIFSLAPVRPRRVVLATARTPVLEGNLLYLHKALRRAHPELDYKLLLEPYSYGLGGKLRYLARLVRGMYYLRTARLFIVDNAYFPIHVAPAGGRTTVVQVWHAAGALKRFGLDTPALPAQPEPRFLHRNYDYVVVGGEATRAPYAAALRTPLDRVLALGTPRTDFFFDRDAMARARARLLAAHPQLDGRRVVLYAPTFRGRGEAKRAAAGFDAQRLRALLPPDYALVLKTHPNLDRRATPTAGYDAVMDPATDINELFTLTDVLVTDYSSSLFEWALLRRPLVLLVGDLAEYEVDPGLYLDYRTEMIGTQVVDADGAAAAILGGDFDLSGYDAFVERHLGASRGEASAAFVRHFLGAAAEPVPVGLPAAAELRAGDRLPSHVSHE
jgi:CDP-ribitol ribitolphosphotransferase